MSRPKPGLWEGLLPTPRAITRYAQYCIWGGAVRKDDESSLVGLAYFVVRSSDGVVVASCDSEEAADAAHRLLMIERRVS